MRCLPQRREHPEIARPHDRIHRKTLHCHGQCRGFSVIRAKYFLGNLTVEHESDNQNCQTYKKTNHIPTSYVFLVFVAIIQY